MKIKLLPSTNPGESVRLPICDECFKKDLLIQYEKHNPLYGDICYNCRRIEPEDMTKGDG